MKTTCTNDDQLLVFVPLQVEITCNEITQNRKCCYVCTLSFRKGQQYIKQSTCYLIINNLKCHSSIITKYTLLMDIHEEFTQKYYVQEKIMYYCVSKLSIYMCVKNDHCSTKEVGRILQRCLIQSKFPSDKWT